MRPLEDERIPRDLIPQIATHLSQSFERVTTMTILRDDPDLEFIRIIHTCLIKRELAFIDLVTHMHLRWNTLKTKFRNLNLRITLKPGPLPSRNIDKISRKIDFLRNVVGLSPGYKRTAASITQPAERPPYAAVYSLMFHPEPRIFKPMPSHNHRLNARYVDYIWHTDLHEVGMVSDLQENSQKLDLIAFIDDASRYLMGAAYITDKSAQTTAAFLRWVLQSNPAPAILGSDNGGEFRGRAFTNLLAEFGIRAWYGEPYTPQQNGKMERFWGTLERSVTDSRNPTAVTNFLTEYNLHWKHSGIGMTPAEARFRIPNYRTVEGLRERIDENLIWAEESE
jgi:transposase InsO family protein